MPDISKTSAVTDGAAKDRYLKTDKSINVQEYLQKMDKEEKSGLKNIEVRDTPKQLGKDDFLKLLITQLSKQDPTNPMKDQDFIAQMAQFSSLEQMKNISSSMQKMENRQSYNLVGKVVSGPDFINGETVTGVVGALFFDTDGKIFARVNGRTIDVDKINLISDPSMLKIEESENLDSGFSKSSRSKEESSESVPGKSDAKEYPGSLKSKRNAYDK